MTKSWGWIQGWFWYVSTAMSGMARQRVYIYRELSTGKIIRALAGPQDFESIRHALEPPHPSGATAPVVVVVGADADKTKTQTGKSSRPEETEG